MYDANFKIILFGDETEGKKTLTNNYMINLFSSSQVDSLGVDFEVKSLFVNDFKVKLQVWDISGERRFRDLLPKYISHARGGLFVYDAVEKSSLTNIDFWLSLVKKELTSEEKFPIIAVGLAPESIVRRQITSEEGKIFADLHGLDGFIECRITSRSDIEKMFEMLSKIMIECCPPSLESTSQISKLKENGSRIISKKKERKKKKHPTPNN
ncbi:MAG: Rab family GTPase [Candidatus Hermodarchaeota archaeon]